MQSQDVTSDIDELRPIMKYIEVFIDEYPNPLLSKELAEKATVSRAAVSKQKRRIRSLCNIDEFVYNTRMVLKSDSRTFTKVGMLYLLEGKLNRFLLSPYTLRIITRVKVHDELSKSIDEYSKHFTKQDTENMILIAFRSLGKLKVMNAIATRVSDPQQRVMLLSFQYAQAIGDFLNNLDLPINSDRDLKLILTLRDKLFYLARDVCQRLVGNASILASLPDDERKRYIEVYFQTIDFYLREFFDSGTRHIKRIADIKKIQFKDSYVEIGNFYQPQHD
jgi:hypothetical protein